MSKKAKEMVRVTNELDRPIAFPLTATLAGGASGMVDKAVINPKFIEREWITVEGVEAPAADEPDAPDAPDADAGELTLDDYAQKLADGEVVIAEDDFTGSGVPSVDALGEAFGREFTADERNVVWEKSGLEHED